MYSKTVWKNKTPFSLSFTLLELLIVIAIFAILVSLISPTMQKTLGNANMLMCTKQQQSMFQILTIYVDDFDGICPGPSVGGQFPKAIHSNGKPDRNIPGYFAPYVVLTMAPQKFQYIQEMICPSNDSIDLAKSPHLRPQYITYHISGFGRPLGYPSNSWGGTSYDPKPYHMIPSPTTAAFYSDVDYLNYKVAGFYDILSKQPIHFGVNRNFIYFDGHTDTVELLP